MKNLDDRDYMINQLGRRIGSIKGKDQFYHVYDGKVWMCFITGNFVFVGDYFEFCDNLRNGLVPGFIPVNDFHLKNADTGD